MLCGVSTPVISRRRPSRSMAPNSRQPRAGEPAPLEWNARTGHNGRPWEGAWGHGGASSRAWSRPAWPRARAPRRPRRSPSPPPAHRDRAGPSRSTGWSGACRWGCRCGTRAWTCMGTMRLLAQRVRDAGVTHIEGAVVGSTGYFKRDWFAPGWKRDFPRSQVALPTALTFEGNQAGGIHVSDPELRAARALRRELREIGVSVAGPATAAEAPTGLVSLAEITSDPLAELLDTMNRYSSNFWAEVLVKRLGVEVAGVPGSIAKGAAALQGFAAGWGVELRALDGSGLSYANRVSPRGLTRLLEAAEDLPWGEALREALPEPGQGTLGGRLRHLQVHAKPGTLRSISALSGYVWLRRGGP